MPRPLQILAYLWAPMMQQYEDAKQSAAMRCCCSAWAISTSCSTRTRRSPPRVLGLTLTSRDKGENPIPMAGFPYHQLDSYLGKLIAAGYRAAVCEQVEDPKLAKGLVKREVTRVVTPGTLTDDALLDPRESNYLAAVDGTGGKETRGDRKSAWRGPTCRPAGSSAAVFPAPQLAINWRGSARPNAWSATTTNWRWTAICRRWCSRGVRPGRLVSMPRCRADPAFSKRLSLEGFGFERRRSAGRARRRRGAGLPARDAEDVAGPHRPADSLPPRASLEIDEATRRSLELTRTIRGGGRDGSLLAVLDRTTTAMGSRLLGEWLANPLTDREAIESRLDAVEELIGEDALRGQLREHLRGVYDLQRLLARVTTGRASPRDLSFIGRTLAGCPS
jgi:DNA mismatch repair protein MutS